MDKQYRPYRRSKCFVPGCKSGYSSDQKKNKRTGARNPAKFLAPKNDELFKSWSRAIPRADRVLEKKDVVCQLHFDEDQIIKFFETKLPNGEVHRIERDKYLLKDGAVPCKFPNLPAYLSKSPAKRKAPKERNSPSKKLKADSNREEKLNTELQSTSGDFNYLEDEDEMFNTLKCNLHTFDLPNGWISGYSKERAEIVFFKTDDFYEVKKKVIIASTLSVKVLFGNKVIEDDSILTTIKDAEDIRTILIAVDELILCEGIQVTSLSEACTGLGTKRKPRQKQYLVNKCLPCQNFLETRRKIDAASSLKHLEKLKGRVKYVQMKNSCSIKAK